MKKSLLLLTCGVIFASAVAHADPVITVTPWLAPNSYGSPSWPQAAANAITAVENGLASYGAAGPTQFNAVTGTVTPQQGIVTGFSSWMGVAEPGGIYANEYGNRFTFALAIIGNGTQFSISQLSFSSVSTDPGNVLGTGFFYDAGDYDYTSNYVGVRVGADGILGTADDIQITSGPNTQLVDALYSRGSGNSIPVYCTGCTTAQEQALIDSASPTDPFSFTGTYSLGTDSGSGTFNIANAVTSPVPEPSSLLLLGTGVAGLAGTIRRRFKK